MSAIGPGNIGPLNLAASLAGAQRNTADPDRDKAEAAVQKFRIDQQLLAARGLDDVAEAELNADRDADGRSALSYPADSSSGRDETPDPQRDHKPPKPPDAFEERGNVLDVEA